MRQLTKLNKILFVDFYDSFTHNILSGLRDVSLNVSVVGFHQLKKSNEAGDSSFYSQCFEAIILGPGPGHPKEYYKEIEKLFLRSQRKKWIGICLGHQILSLLLDFEIQHSRSPYHGVEHDVIIPNWEEFFPHGGDLAQVCRYNSLAVINKTPIPHSHNDRLYWSSREGEIIGLKVCNEDYACLSFQFHPESVGTSCPRLFFLGIKKFLYNKLYDKPSKSLRYIRPSNSRDCSQPWGA